MPYANKETAKAYHREFQRRWRKKNPVKARAIKYRWIKKNKKHWDETQVVRVRRYQNQRRERLNAWKKGKPCLDCGGVFPPECMDFDHLRDKKFNISQRSGSMSWPKILKEIKKCDLICANCHRIRTKKRWEEKRK